MKNCKGISKRELDLGINIEKEHYKSLKLRKKIVCDHLKEFPNYYSKGLIPLEKKLKRLKILRSKR